MGEQIEQLTKCNSEYERVSAFDASNLKQLCFYPDRPFPAKLKVPDFVKFYGSTYPKIHLRLYAGALCGYADNEQLSMQLFQQSLKGSALQWFARLGISAIHSWEQLSRAFLKHYKHNSDMSIDRCHLLAMSRKPGETFREYATRWMNFAITVFSPLAPEEFSRLFVRTLTGDHFQIMCASITDDFSVLIDQGERMGRTLTEIYLH